MLKIIIAIILMFALTASIGGAGDPAFEYTQGEEYLRRNEVYLEHNRALLANIDAAISSIKSTSPEFEELLNKQFTIIQRVDFLEKRSKALIGRYELVDATMKTTGANKDFRLRMPQDVLIKLRSLAKEKKVATSDLILDALKAMYWNNEKVEKEKTFGQFIKCVNDKLPSGVSLKNSEGQLALISLGGELTRTELDISIMGQAIQGVIDEYQCSYMQKKPLLIWDDIPQDLTLEQTKQIFLFFNTVTDHLSEVIQSPVIE